MNMSSWSKVIANKIAAWNGTQYLKKGWQLHWQQFWIGKLYRGTK